MRKCLTIFIALIALSRIASAIVGDDCTEPFELLALPATLIGNTCAYDNTYGMNCADEDFASDVFYRFVPSENMFIELDLCASGFNTKLYVFENSCSGTLIACNDNSEGACPDTTRSFLTELPLIGGNTYFIAVDGAGDECGDYSLTITVLRPCQSCTPVNVDLGAIDSTICGGSISGDLGWDGKWIARFNAVEGLDYVWDLCPNGLCPGNDNFGYDGDPDILILDNTCDIISWVDGNESCLYRPDEWRWTCPASGTYYVLVGKYPSFLDDTLTCSGTADLSFTMYYYTSPQRPCATCWPTDADLGEFPTEVWDSNISGNCGWNGRWIGQFSGIADAAYHFDMCPDEPGMGTANFDVDIKICDENCQIIAGDDGSCAEPFSYHSNDWVWMCPAEGTYYIVLAPWESWTSHVCNGSQDHTFTMYYYRTNPIPPPGETCLDAPFLEGELPIVAVSNTCASLNDFDVVCSEGTETGGRDVVYRYLSPWDQLVSFGLCQSEFDNKLFIFEGDCEGDPIACCNNWSPCPGTGEWNRAFLPCVPLRTDSVYFIVVDAPNEFECGNYQLTLSACDMIPGDLIETAWVISTLPFTANGTTSGFYNQYEEICPDPSASSDVVYSFTHDEDYDVEIDLSNSCFDLRLYVYENNRDNLVACDDHGSWYTSRPYIHNLFLPGGNTHYFVVDGDYDARGEYQLEILPRATGRCCDRNGTCWDMVTKKQCGYHLGHGDWTADLDCTTPCPEPVAPPAPLSIVNLPVIDGCGFGFTVAADCGGNIYYQQYCSDSLFKMNAGGELLSSVQVTRNGEPTGFVLGNWDSNRQQFWAGVYGEVGLLDPVTGVFTYKFRNNHPGDQIAYDPWNGTVWCTQSACNYLAHFDTTGVQLPMLLPYDQNGSYDGVIVGIWTGAEGKLYLSHPDARITVVDKTTGAFIERFTSFHDSSTGGLACDAVSFAPQTVLWWRLPQTIYAYVVNEGSCFCTCPPADSVTVQLNSAGTHMLVNFVAPSAGLYRIVNTTNRTGDYPANFHILDSLNVSAGMTSWTDTSAIVDYRRYAVIHVCE